MTLTPLNPAAHPACAVLSVPTGVTKCVGVGRRCTRLDFWDISVCSHASGEGSLSSVRTSLTLLHPLPGNFATARTIQGIGNPANDSNRSQSLQGLSYFASTPISFLTSHVEAPCTPRKRCNSRKVRKGSSLRHFAPPVGLLWQCRCGAYNALGRLSCHECGEAFQITSSPASAHQRTGGRPRPSCELGLSLSQVAV